MSSDEGKIICPHCSAELELDELLTHQIREGLRAELQQDVAKREKDVAARQSELEKLQTSLQSKIDEQVKQKLIEAEKKAADRLKDEYDVQLKDLTENLHAQSQKLKVFQEQELELRKAKREVEEQAEAQKLELARALDEERKKIAEQARKFADEEHRLKDLEKDKKLQEATQAVEDMKRRLEQGSMETQGEVLEQDFQQKLESVFRQDRIEPVPKGIRGADVVQHVIASQGASCGIILWETKNTKSWGKDWVPKLKQDMIEMRAEVAIIVSVVLPDDIQRFGELDGVWVSDPSSALPLAGALRAQLLALHRERGLTEGKNDKMELIYRYLSGPEFKQKVEGIVDAFRDMKSQLEAEQRAMKKHWSKREKQIERVIDNTTGMYGDLEGILGNQLPTIQALELEGKDDAKSLPE